MNTLVQHRVLPSPTQPHMKWLGMYKMIRQIILVMKLRAVSAMKLLHYNRLYSEEACSYLGRHTSSIDNVSQSYTAS